MPTHNQFSANAPDQIKEENETEITTIILLHSPRRLLQPQLCASLHFKLVLAFLLCVASLMLAFYAISNSEMDGKRAREPFKKIIKSTGSSFGT